MSKVLTAVICFGVGGLAAAAAGSCTERLMAPFTNAARVGEEAMSAPGVVQINMRSVDIDTVPGCEDIAESGMSSAFKVYALGSVSGTECAIACTAKGRATRWLPCTDSGANKGGLIIL